jgi:hypothetical protein
VRSRRIDAIRFAPSRSSIALFRLAGLIVLARRKVEPVGEHLIVVMRPGQNAAEAFILAGVYETLPAILLALRVAEGMRLSPWSAALFFLPAMIVSALFWNVICFGGELVIRAFRGAKRVNLVPQEWLAHASLVVLLFWFARYGAVERWIALGWIALAAANALAALVVLALRPVVTRIESAVEHEEGIEFER